MSFTKEELDKLKVGDIIKGRCCPQVPISSYNKYCGKSFELMKKEESCVLDYGSDPEPINIYSFVEVDQNNKIKENGINITTDDHWTSSINIDMMKECHHKTS